MIEHHIYRNDDGTVFRHVSHSLCLAAPYAHDKNRMTIVSASYRRDGEDDDFHEFDITAEGHEICTNAEFDQVLYAVIEAGPDGSAIVLATTKDGAVENFRCLLKEWDVEGPKEATIDRVCARFLSGDAEAPFFLYDDDCFDDTNAPKYISLDSSRVTLMPVRRQ